jgi:Fe-S-cluster-containing hydrogenase component 2
LITYYGYTDASGEYYVVVDSDKCSGCGKCVTLCPASALELESVFVDLEDKMVAVVKEEHRNKIRFTCGQCRPEENCAPCVLGCPFGAVRGICVVR